MGVERLFTNILGTPVVDDDFKRPIAFVRDVLIDPERGNLIALVVDISRNLVVAPIDILAWGEAIRVPAHDAIVEGKEIFRVAEVQKNGIRIFHNRVETKKKEYIGNVVDFSIDSQSLTLRKLYTSKSILGLLRYDHRIIPAKNIEEVFPKKIIVKENAQHVYQESKAMIEEAVA
ncbi:MAG: PRC-barrel domain-containing protein [Candidatus Gracilibacteria bacterium]